MAVAQLTLSKTEQRPTLVMQPQVTPIMKPAASPHEDNSSPARMVWWELPLGLAVCLGILFSGVFQLYPPIGWVDPGIYISWFVDPASSRALQGLSYFGTRLPFILVGFSSYRWLDPMAAHIVLVLCFYAIGVCAIHALAAALLDKAMSRIGVVIICGLNPLWVAAFVHGYVDGPAIALGLAGLAAFAHGVGRAAPRLWLAGGCLAAAIVTHPFGGGLAGLAALAGLLAGSAKASAILRDGCHMAIGGACMVVSLTLAAMILLDMPHSSLLQVLPTAFKAVTNTSTSFLLPLDSWLPGAPRVALFVMVPLVLAGSFREAFGAPVDRRRRMLFAMSAIPLTFVLAALSSSHFLLQFPFYSSYLFLPLVPTLVLFMSSIEKRAAGGLNASWTVAFLIMAACIVLGASMGHWLRDSTHLQLLFWGSVLAAGATFAAALALSRPRAALLALVAALSLCGVANSETATVLRVSGGPDQASQHQALQRFRSILAQAGAVERPYRIWFNRADFEKQSRLARHEVRLHHFGGAVMRLNALDSLAASLGWDAAQLGDAMPQIQPQTVRILGGVGDNPLPLVTLCALPAGCGQGLEALRDLGLDVSVTVAESVAVAGTPHIHVVIARVTAPHPTAVPSVARVRHLFAAKVEGQHQQSAPTDAFQVVDVSNVTCASGRAISHCAFDYKLSSGERGASFLALTRVGALWFEAAPDPMLPIPTIKPSADAMLRLLREAMLAGPNARLFLRDRVIPQKLWNLICEPSAARSICSFDVALSDGRASEARLVLERRGDEWYLPGDGQSAEPLRQPKPEDVRRFFTSALLDRPNAALALPTPLVVERIDVVSCEGVLNRRSCTFSYGLPSGDRGVGRLLLVWTELGWWPAGNDPAP